jgi:hypothetical protein
MPAFYIVLQETIPGVDATGLEGRALSKHTDKLDSLAKEAHVQPLLSFFSVNTEEAMAFFNAHEVAPQGIQIPDEQWFSAEEGLNTITVLLKSVGLMAAAERLALAKELTDFQQVLEAAQVRNVRWHLAIDY